jgi:FlaG/FlaF family flagellin (archaellin)
MIIKENRKGISTFIATLLLMVLAVSAGVVIYAYTMGYLGGFGGPQTMGAISLDTYNFVDNTHLKVYVRNIGKTTFELQSVYIDGVSVSTTSEKNFDPLTIDENGVKDTTITYTTGFGTITHVIKLIGVDNTQISFNAKK